MPDELEQIRQLEERMALRRAKAKGQEEEMQKAMEAAEERRNSPTEPDAPAD
jgi:hypothetical protein